MSETSSQKTFLQKYQDVMPRGAGALFLIQIFATLGFSVLYSTLILYTTQALHLSDGLATSITGAFIALNYFLHLLGGYVGGRYLSYRSLFSISMILQLFGLALISIPTFNALIWGLALFLTGSGLNVTCINCMVTQLFDPNDKRREAAFLWNYSGMNIGFFIGFSIGGYFQLTQGYQTLFLLSGLGNLIAFLLTLYNWKLLKDRDTIFLEKTEDIRRRLRFFGIFTIAMLFLSLRYLMQHTEFCNQLIVIIGSGMLLTLCFMALQQETLQEKKKMFGYIILALASIIFWTLYQLAPMGLNLFIERNVDRHLFGFIIAPQWIQNINTMVIILGGPILSMVFTRLRDKGINIHIPAQFAFSLILIGIALALLPIGIQFADAKGYVNINWVLVTYMLISTAELFISPIGYAMVGQLAPIKLRGIMMGTWMMITGVAAILSNHFSQMALAGAELDATTQPLVTNSGYAHTFNLLGWGAILAGVVLSLFVPKILKLTQENNQDADRKLDETTNLALKEQAV